MFSKQLDGKTQLNFQKVVAACILILITSVTVAADLKTSCDKTLVSWVALTDREVRAGTVLTVQRFSKFDGIVFAEKAPYKWMAGSDGYSRTQSNQKPYPQDTSDGKTFVQMAIVYKNDTISIYRNGESYASYPAKNIDLLSGEDNIVSFGTRSVGGWGSIGGSIEDARIYSRALSVNELNSLEPNSKSDIEPYAWWDFEGDTIKDRQGIFTEHKLRRGAKVADGKLVLGRNSSLVASRSSGPETPVWPENPPANSLSYHLAHPGPGPGYPGDPNPAFYYKGRYHLHYIYRNQTGFVFGHVSSTDMVHWKWHPTVLGPDTTGHGMFSGTGFFTKEGKAAMVYHGQGSNRNWISYAMDDNMDKWSKPELMLPSDKDGNPVTDTRYFDPDIWLMDGVYYGLNGVSSKKPPVTMKSDDLKNWEYIGELLHEDFDEEMLGVPRGEDISCPNIFKIGDKWMLLCISHRLGCRYFLGDFKDEKYLPESHFMMSWNGNNYFAPESLVTKDGRRVMWAWLIGMPISPTAVQALPRELELPADGVLRIRPLRELEALRYDKKQDRNITVKSDRTHLLKGMNGDALELKIKFNSPTAKEFGLDVLCNVNGDDGMRIAVNLESKQLRVGRVTAPFNLKQGEDLTLRVFVDKNLVEVFANDVQAVVAARADCPPQNTHARLFSAGGDLKAETVTAWKMKSIYEGKTTFNK
ncbi:MAG: hypothetical protein FVQ82_16495 [Planctomycetes bacterium]|nr:hypothetical protein [Planctomycetota bacterium]